jgi:CxxC-x17-CxxC domain-containing protein
MMKKQMQKDSPLLDQMAKIQEHLISLEKKIDILMSRPVSQPLEVKQPPKLFQPPVVNPSHGNGRPNNRHDHHPPRPMYETICADCKKQCSVPFKPTGDRPVYCKECFSHRKNGGTFKAVMEKNPNQPPVVQAISEAINTNKTQAKKKAVAIKKPVGKKKTVSKKK